MKYYIDKTIYKKYKDCKNINKPLTGRVTKVTYTYLPYLGGDITILDLQREVFPDYRYYTYKVFCDRHLLLNHDYNPEIDDVLEINYTVQLIPTPTQTVSDYRTECLIFANTLRILKLKFPEDHIIPSNDGN